MDSMNISKEISMKTIKSYLPLNSAAKTSTVQGQVDAELVKAVKKIMVKHKLKWSQLLTACLQAMKEEMNG